MVTFARAILTKRVRRISLLLLLLAVLFPEGMLRGQEGPPSSSIQLYPVFGGVRTSQAVVKAGQTVDPLAEAIAKRLGERIAALTTPNGQAMPPPQSTTKLDEAVEELHRRLGSALRVRMRNPAGTPREIGGISRGGLAGGVGRGKDQDEATARAFLRASRAVLRLADPDRELTLRRKLADPTGRRHLRFSQMYHGLPVWPAELTVHLDRTGRVDLMNGAFVPTPKKVVAKPVLDADAAARRGRLAVEGGDQADVSPPVLIFYAPGDRPPRLAWRLEINISLDSRWLVVVDALNGMTLAKYSRVMRDGVTGSGVDLFGMRRPIHLWEEDSTYFMVDTSKPMFDPTSDPPAPLSTRGAIAIQDAVNEPPNPDRDPPLALHDVTSSNKDAWTVPDSVSAAFGLSETYDYYLERHGRDSIDGEGGTILGVVRYGRSYQNAVWNSGQQLMAFGNGLPFAGALDVVGHELTHGITDHTAKLLYRDQSGALNEAFSDIFGEMVEARTKGAPDWLIGADLGTSLRDMADPSSLEICSGCGRHYPSTMGQFIAPDDPFLSRFPNRDSGGVHLNSSIINHAFYLLAEGLQGAIGLRDAERIFFRALTFHLVANSQFVDARLACIQSAEELFGADSVPAQKTAEAFDAVGILDALPTPEPTPFPSVSGPDSTLFLYRNLFGQFFMGRREDALGDSAPGVPLSSFRVAQSRPSVSGDGSFAVFVNAVHDVCLIPTDGSIPEDCLGFAGEISSVAMSPDGKLFGFVLWDSILGEPKNSITVIDVRQAGAGQTFPLLAPALDGVSSNSILFADTMDFTADGRFLVYDAFNVITFVDGSQSGLWSIYALDLGAGTFLTMVPPVPGFDVGFPALSQTSDDFITFDAFDQAANQSTVYAGNLNTGDLAAIGAVAGDFGVPGYTGDNSAIVYSQRDVFTFTGFSLLRQKLAGDHITAEGALSLWLEDGEFGVIYRRGDFIGPNQAPIVDAGPDQAAVFPAEVFLGGSVSDDGRPDPPGSVTTGWGKVTGPGFVSFADSLSPGTMASFSVSGTYVLRLTADDGALSSNDDVQVKINKADTTTTLGSNQNPSAFGQSVTFTAIVTGSGVTVGTVTFKDGASVLCGDVALDGDGHASCAASTLGVGSHTIIAEYSGSVNFNPNSGTLAGGQLVIGIDTAVAVTSDFNPSNLGQPVTFTARVTGSVVTEGTVTFTDSSTVICGDVPLDASGQAVCTTTFLTAGTRTITAEYSGSANFNAASGSLSQRVNGPPQAVAVVRPLQTVVEMTHVVLDGEASTDPNEDEREALAFWWTQKSGPIVQLVGQGTRTASFTAPRIEDPFAGSGPVPLVFELEVTDPSGLSDQATIEVEVISTMTLLDHFLCYKARGSGFERQSGVRLEDQFEDKLMDVRKPLGFCNPTRKMKESDEGELEINEIVDPDTHLEAYQIKDTKLKPKQPRFSETDSHAVVNQFGTLVVNASKVDQLLVPTAEPSNSGALDETEVDHYKCYKVNYADFEPVEVALEDQFAEEQGTGPLIFTVKKPLRLCNPVSKQDEGIKNEQNHLMCYQVKLAKTKPKQPKFPNPKPNVSVTNQFGSEVIDVKAVESLCVPSLKDPP